MVKNGLSLKRIRGRPDTSISNNIPRNVDRVNTDWEVDLKHHRQTGKKIGSSDLQGERVIR